MEETTNTQENLEAYKWDGTWAFYEEMRRKYGEAMTKKMYEVLHAKAMKLKVGESIDIIKLCRNAEKIPYAVKICCVIVASQNTIRIQNKSVADFVMNSRYNKLTRIA